MVVFTGGRAPSKRREVSAGAASKRKVSVGGQGRPDTLDARFSMLQSLHQQAKKRQTANRSELLAKKRGVKLEQPAQVLLPAILASR